LNHNAVILIREIANRIEEASGSIVMDLDTWEKLCLLILPEWYQDRPDDDRGPTHAAPGSEEKIIIIEGRVERGRSPFHADDLRLDMRPAPERRGDYYTLHATGDHPSIWYDDQG